MQVFFCALEVSLKKILLLLSILLLIPSFLFAANYTWQVAPIEIHKYYTDDNGVHQKETYYEYMLYYGNEETRKAEEYLWRSHQESVIYFMHCSIDWEPENVEDPHQWYRHWHDGIYGTSPWYSVFDEKSWEKIPQILKDIFLILDYNDPDLILIGLDLKTKTIRIHYHPKYDEDKGFYDRKLEQLMKGLRAKEINC